ncbi:hypothetical protein LY90DRAFT_664357, partial [Neocallimastix californiae]
MNKAGLVEFEFKAGNRKELPKLSKEAITHAKKMLGDDLFDDNMNNENLSNKNEPMEFGFKTGNGKELPKLSKEAIAHAKKMLGDDLFDDNNMNNEMLANKNEPVEFGFKTGNGKELPKLSKEAITKAKKMLGDDLFDDDNMNNESLSNKNEPMEFGFKTGNGKELPKLSKEAIIKAKKMLGDDLFDDNVNNESLSNKNEPMEFGFKTGNGKELPKLSKEAVTKAKKMLGDDLFDDDNMNSEMLANKNEPIEFGFKTGNGKELPKLSKEAITKAKKMLGDDLFDDDNMNSEMLANKNEPMEFGFKTGNGKELPKLSKEAITKAKKMLGDDLFDDDNMNSEMLANKNEPMEFGFKTGNGKELPKLSKEAITDAKKMLSDDLFDDKVGNEMQMKIKEIEKENFTKENRNSKSSIKLINNKVYKKIFNNNKENIINKISIPSENKENVLDMNYLKNSNIKKDYSINKFSRKFITNKKNHLRKKSNEEKNILKPLHIINKNNNILKPKPFLTNIKNIAKPLMGNNINSKTIGQVKKKKYLSNRPFKLPSIVKPIEDNNVYNNKVTNNSNNKNTVDFKQNENKKSLAEVFRFLPQNFTQEHVEKILGKDIAIMNPQIASTYRFRINNMETWGSHEAYQELKQYNLNMNIATEDWVDNHYKWIVWKIASMIRTENSLYKEYWNKDKIIEQLLFRYNKENNLRKHSALKLIIERDNISTKYMILCVSGIVIQDINDNDNNTNNISENTNKTPEIYLELTDGWYSINAKIDQILQKAVKDKKIFIGQKLCISGAKLIGSNDPLPVLEANDLVRLNLTANSTRIAKWDTKLGYQNHKSFKISLCYIQPLGGQISMVDVVVMKKYSICYSEKKGDGIYILRNQTEEEEEEENLNNIKIKQFQNEIDNYNKQNENKNKKMKHTRKLTKKELVSIMNGEDLYNEMEKYHDTYSFLELISESQKRILNDYINEKKTAEYETIRNDFLRKTNKLNNERNVSSFLRIKVCDYFTENKKNYEKKYVYLTIWNPNIKTINSITEGKRYQIFYPKVKPENNNIKYSLSLNGLNNILEKPVEDNVLKNTLYKPREIITFNCFASLTIGSEIDVVAYCLAIHYLDPKLNSNIPLKAICILSDNTKNFLIVEITSNVKCLRNFNNYQNPIFIRNLKIKGFNESCNLFIGCINIYTEVKLHSTVIYEKEKWEILKDWTKTNNKEFYQQKIISEEILSYIIDPSALKPIINHNIYNINAFSPLIPKRNLLLNDNNTNTNATNNNSTNYKNYNYNNYNNNSNNRNSNDTNKTLFNEIPELFEIAKLAPNVNDQLNLINKIDHKLYHHNSPLINLNKNQIHNIPSSLIRNLSSNENLERNKLLREWVWKSVNYRTFSIYAHLDNLFINYDESNKIFNINEEINTKNVDNNIQFILTFDNGDLLWKVQLGLRQFLDFLSLKESKKIGCYCDIEDDFYKDILKDLMKSIQQHTNSHSLMSYKRDLNKKKLNSMIIEILEEKEMPSKNEVKLSSLINNFIDQFYYYGIINVDEEKEDQSNKNINANINNISVDDINQKNENNELKSNKENNKNDDRSENKDSDKNKDKVKDENSNSNSNSYANANENKNINENVNVNAKENIYENRIKNQSKNSSNKKEFGNETDIKLNNNKNNNNYNYRPSWWKEYILNAFENLRIQYWNNQKIKNSMTREEFIFWVLKNGKIVKDEDLWQNFIIWIKQKKLNKKENNNLQSTNSNDNILIKDKNDNNYLNDIEINLNNNNNNNENLITEIINDNNKKDKNELEYKIEKIKLDLEDEENNAYSEVIEIFIDEMIVQKSKHGEDKSFSLSFFTLLFHEDEWNQIIKLVTSWLKESQFKLLLLKEKSTLSYNTIFKYLSIHIIN